MAPERPLLWRAFDAADKAVAPRLEEVVSSGRFLDLLGLAARTQAGLRGALESQSRRVWHLLNLPAGSDVTRLRRQLADVDRELQRVSVALERIRSEQQRSQREGDADDPHRAAGGRPARAQRATGASSTGRRAERAEGS